MLDPGESRNLVGDPGHADIHVALRDRLDEWMLTTDDPLLHGPVDAAARRRVTTTPTTSPRPRLPGPAETGAVR